VNALLVLVWTLPLLGAIVLWAFGPQLRQRGAIVGVGAVALSFVFTLVLAAQGAHAIPAGAASSAGLHVPLVSWVGGFDFGLLLDPLSLLWVLVITGIGGLIHVYSIGYMDRDRAFARFFSYLNFFVFAMLTLVLSDNFVGLLIGWGLVGLASYFLIGFWFERPTAVVAARKAFVINVVGDIGLMFAVFAIYAQTQSTGFAPIFARAASLDAGTLLTICIALFIACAAKSAQVPLHTWLPDAMEGPTPVSALIHAATMVTAGVYLIARCAPFWSHSPAAQELVGIVGALTALLGAVLGLAQWDIKRILAYSTMSQIGYMIMGVGVGAYDAGVLHFLTHAFFKAQLFLTAGLVIHALHDEQDVRKMGGLRRAQPFAFVAMSLGVLAICGVPGFSGSYSKDAVVYGLLQHGHPLLYAVGVLTAGITSYYMFRMLFVAFLGTSRGAIDDAALGIAPSARLSAHAEEPAPHPQTQAAPAWLMQAPVAVLCLGTVGAGWLFIGGEASPWARFLAPVFGPPPALPAPAISELLSTLIVLVVVAAGVALAYLRYGTAAALAGAPERLQREGAAMPLVLARAFYFDDVIREVFVLPARAFGDAFSRIIDPHVIDAAVRDVAWIAGYVGARARGLQTGLVRGYVMTLAAGVAAFVAYFAFIGGPH